MHLTRTPPERVRDGAPLFGYSISDDESLKAWVQSLEGKPVLQKASRPRPPTGHRSFSRRAIASLDYVQADCLGIPESVGCAIADLEAGLSAG